MKNIKSLSVFILFLFLFNLTSFAQDKKDIKSVLKNIIELSKEKKYDEAAKLIAYSADDKKKDYKTVTAANKDQMNYVKRVVKRISALSEVSSSFNIGDIKQEKIGTIDYQSVTVDFISGTQKISSGFRFITLNGALLLAEIE